MCEVEILVKLGDGNVMKDYESDTNPYKALLKAMNIAHMFIVDEGWDYPPRMGSFRNLSPRTCPNCTIEKTVWWALAMEGKSVQDLDDKQIKTLLRIMMEPESIMPPKSMGGL